MSTKHLSYPKGYSNILTGNLPNGTYLEWSKIDNAIKIAYHTSGTATTDTINELVDIGASFNSTVSVGDVVKNTTDSKYAFVTVVNSDTSLTLDWDAFPDGNEGYEIYSAPVIPNGFVDVTEGDQYISDSDSEYNGMTIEQRLPEVSLKYDTGWIQRTSADWRNQELVVTHNLNTDFQELLSEVWIANNDTPTNPQKLIDYTRAYNNPAGSTFDNQYGMSIIPGSDSNSIKIQTGSHGILYFETDGSIKGLLDSSTGAYRVTIHARTYGNILLFKYKDIIATAQQLRVNELVVNETYTSRVSLPIGTILPWSGEEAPSGFLPCDGRAISRTSYPDLKSLYEIGGYKWGSGDGASTFNIPDFENLTLAEDPGVPNTIRVGPNEWQFTADNELDYTSSIADATTVTVSELPTNTIEMVIYIAVANTSSSDVGILIKRNSSDTNDMWLYQRGAATGSHNLNGVYKIPTDGNSFYIENEYSTCTIFKIIGFKTSNENTTDPLGTYIVKASNTSFEATVDATDIDDRLTYLENAFSVADSYDTGWVSISDLTATEISIAHNLNSNVENLFIELWIADDNNGTNQFKPKSASVSTGDYGYEINPDDNNNFNIIFAANGLLRVNTASVYEFTAIQSNKYYRVKVYKPSATSLYKAKREILGSYKYETNWTANSDWTNAEFLITHNLNANLSDMIVKFYVSTDGTEANAFEPIIGDSSTGNRGCSFFQASANQIYVQTGTGGLTYIRDDGTHLALTTESYYYKVVVYKPDLVSTIADNAESRLTNIETFLTAGQPNVANTVRVGSHEWQFTADNELDYTTTFSTTGTKTISELPSNTTAILINAFFNGGGNNYVETKRTSGDIEIYTIQQYDSAATNIDYGVTIELPTNGNQIYVLSTSVTSTRFHIYGFKTSASSFTPTIPSQQVNKVFHIEDQKTDNTPGGTATSGAWQTRVLNTIITNEIPGASLNSNQFILPAGTYEIEASAPAYYVNRHQIRLRNITDSINISIGSSEFSGASTGPASTRSFLKKHFTITSSKVFEIQHQVATTSSTQGFGVESGGSFTVDHETYTQVWIRQVAI